MRLRNKRRPKLHHWHKYLGLFAGVFTLWITLSGVLLNHSPEFGLDQKQLPNSWALTRLNTQAPSVIGYKTGGQQWVIQLNDRLYLNSQQIATNSGLLIGAISLPQMLVVATAESLWLFDHTGQLIEHMGWRLMLPSLPKKIAIATEGQLIVYADNKWYSSDDALFNWQPVTARNFHLVQPTQLPEKMTQQLTEGYSGKSMSYEQLLLGLHTGRIFGKYGVYLIDLIAIILATLAISGFTVWLRRL